MTTRHHVSAFTGAAAAGSLGAFYAASFIGLRHLIIQGNWREDREAVSGLAAGMLAGTSRALTDGPRVGALAGMYWFIGGCAAHHAHRYWLYYRLRQGW